jgi:isopenicillin N synthase-like dioxygenase
MPEPLTLPIISISPYLSSRGDEYSEADRFEVAQNLHRACRDIGFFYLKVDDYLTEGETRGVLDLGREFFLHSSDEEKARIGLDQGDGVRGKCFLSTGLRFNKGFQLNTGGHYVGYQKLKQNVTMGKADHHEGLDFYADCPYPPDERRDEDGRLKPLG